jgi:hypothetical protein
MADGKKPFYWTSGMPKVGNNYNSLTPDAANNTVLSFTATVITAVGDGYFNVAGGGSTNGTEYYWIAFFSG